MAGASDRPKGAWPDGDVPTAAPLVHGGLSAERPLARYARWVVRRPGLILGLSLLATMGVGFGAHLLKVEVDPEKGLPDHPYVEIDRRIRKEFGGKNFIALAVVPRDGSIWRREALQRVHDLTWSLLNAPGIIRQNVLSLSSPYVRVPQDHNGVLTFDYLMRDVPEDASEIAALRERYEGEPLFHGALVSADNRAAMVLADFYDDAKSDPASQVEELAARFSSPDFRVAVTGVPVVQRAERAIVQRQGRYFLGTIAAILLVLFLAFGQLQGVVLPVATALLSTLWAMGFMGWAGIHLNGWTTAVPVVVVTVAAGHSAQMLKRYYEEARRLGDRTKAVIAATANIGPVMAAAGITAASGFVALSILAIPELTAFGLAVATGIAAAVVLELTFMLALRILWPTNARVSGEGPLSRALTLVTNPVGTAVVRHARAICVVFLFLAGVSVLLLGRLSTDFNPRTYWSAGTEVGADLRVFDRHFPHTTTLTVLLEGEPGSMRTPPALKLMEALGATMEAEPAVGRTDSLADIVRRTRDVFAPDQAGADLYADPALVAQLLYLAESPAFESYLDATSSRAVVRGFLEWQDTAAVRRAINRIERYVADHPTPAVRVSIAGGSGPTLIALNDHTVAGKTINIVILIAAIVTVGSLLLRTPWGGVFIVAPVVAALLAQLAVFAIAGIPFDLAGASIVAVGVGVGADYAIYVLFRIREEYGRASDLTIAVTTGIETAGRAVLFVALAISAGFAVYAFATFYPLRLCGFFIPFAMMLNAFSALTLLPALVMLVRPRFICR